MTRIGIHGSAGRMGRRLVALAGEEGLQVVEALESPGHELLGRDAGELAGVGALGVKVAEGLEGRAEVLIDFSQPLATAKVVEACRQRGLRMVIGTTGLDESVQRLIEAAAKEVGVVQAANMSVGINLLLDLVGQVARRLGEEFDIEIVEAHHRFKKDAPSGTARALVEAIRAATNQAGDVVYGRQGKEAGRRSGEIGVHAIRSGDVVGRHTVIFGGLGEEVRLQHIASTRDVFARGALRASRWLADKGPGLYGMRDVLGGR